jgi:maleylpyruvate isomerase
VDLTDVGVTLPWMGAGTEFFFRVVDALRDDVLRGPSGLPGWTRAHVVAHVARNAEGLTRLATWARTGVETPMYPSKQARDTDIEASAQFPVERIRAELISTADELDGVLASLTPAEWRAELHDAQGSAMPASRIVWMRVREMWLHAVDLDAGARMEDVPGAVVDALFDDVTLRMSGFDGCPAATLVPTDRDHTWPLGLGEGVQVHGPAAALLGWLIGRSGPKGLVTIGGELPDPPRWL